MTLWLEVTQDDFELPLIVAHSAQELADKTGTNVNNIHKCVSRLKKGEIHRGRFVKVEISNDEH